MVGWHHQLNGHESEQTPGDSEGQGSLTCYPPWDLKEFRLSVASRSMLGQAFGVTLNVT